LGNCFYDQQQLDSAVVCYQNAIQLNPSFAQAHYNLGNVLKNQDLLAQAEQSYKNALSLDANNIWILDNLAHVLYEQSHFVEAESCYEKALKIQPDFVAAHIGLGAVAKALDQLQEAEDSFKKAIEIGAAFEAYSNLADLLHAADRLAEAEACIQAGISAHPNSVDAYVKMAVFLRTVGRVPESIPYFAQALSIDQSRKDVHVDLGLAKAEQGLFAEAEACYLRALELDLDYWLAYNNLGLALHRMERYQEAELAFGKAIALHPSEALLYSNLGLTLAALGQIKRAELSLKKAVEILPEYVNAHINLCTNFIAQGRLEEAEYECFEALKYDPASNKARSNLLFAMNYSGHHSAEYRLEQALAFDHVVTEKVQQAYTTWKATSGRQRLRIGLMSGDLRQHPVAYFLENWAKNVDFSQFELIAYLTDIREDAFTGRLKPNFAHWKSLVGLTDQAAAELIHQDGIDILLDLSGHTSGNRLQILAWKPAPIQVSWLGYFATTGMKSVDYFIADEVGVPAAHYAHFVEKIKYLPDTRLCFTAPHVAVDVSALPALTNDYITFASFQTLAKAGDDVLAIWAAVMLALPNAKLRWQCKSFGDADVTADMVTRFAKLGVSADRLTLLGSVSREAYFVAHHEVDVILDTFPYPGGTTTCEALWMGVPTLTLAGDSLIARQGASMLSAAGLADWVAETKDEYLDKALSLCSDLNQLANLRAGLRAQALASPLFDAERFAKNMETALWEMWHEHYPAAETDKLASGNKAELSALTNNADEHSVNSSTNRHVQIVSATRYSEQDFWRKSALGLSLHRHLKQSRGVSASVAFNNTLGLSDVFNQAIEQADDNAILVFVHDDVWIDEANFVDTLIAGLERFDVIGVAGNKRRLPNQPAWLFVDTALNWDEPEYLSGTVSHGLHAFGKSSFYGEAPAACELLDGVFIATTKSALESAHVRFDHQFDFHLYDIDFCRSAREAGLHLGTWPIKLTHQSKGAFGSPHWGQKCQLYFNKWEHHTPQQQALHDAMDEVMEMALQHEAGGQLEQAVLLYQEVLKINPDNPEANYKQGILVFNLHGIDEALPLFEKAVLCKPEIEQYWVTYIDALMQAGATSTAADALELGQQYGLRVETAQMLAAEFVEQIEKMQQVGQLSPSHVVAANPVLTTLIPAYKTQYIFELLSCLSTQTYTNIKVVVSDDSPNNEVTTVIKSAKFAEILKKLNLDIIEGPKKGSSANVVNLLNFWNQSTPYVHILFDDDLIYPTFYQMHLTAHSKGSIGASVSYRWVGNELGVPISSPRIPSFISDGLEKVDVLSANQIFPSIVPDCVNWLGEFSNTVYSASAAWELKPATLNGIPYNGLGDIGLCLHTSLSSNIAIIKEHLGLFRVNPHQNTGNFSSISFRCGYIAWIAIALGSYELGKIDIKQTEHAIHMVSGIVHRLFKGNEEMLAFARLQEEYSVGSNDFKQSFIQLWETMLSQDKGWVELNQLNLLQHQNNAHFNLLEQFP
jgi:predicted O-linked N-acetylglucosamine transferase (SPINDLY family)/GT2 family glycosyltransferase